MPFRGRAPTRRAPEVWETLFQTQEAISREPQYWDFYKPKVFWQWRILGSHDQFPHYVEAIWGRSMKCHDQIPERGFSSKPEGGLRREHFELGWGWAKQVFDFERDEGGTFPVVEAESE